MKTLVSLLGLAVFATNLHAQFVLPTRPKVASKELVESIKKFESRVTMRFDQFGAWDKGQSVEKEAVLSKLEQHYEGERAELIKRLEQHRKAATVSDELDEAIQIREAIKHYKQAKIADPDRSGGSKMAKLRDEVGALKLEIAELRKKLESLPSGFVQAMSDVAPGFEIFSDVDGGLVPIHGVIASFSGKKNVLVTHPFERAKPAMLKRKIFPSRDDKPVLRFSVSHHQKGDWRLVVTANTEVVYDQNINRKTTENGWHNVSIDLSAFSGREVELQLNNVATGWMFEQAFWHKVEIVSSAD